MSVNDVLQDQLIHHSAVDLMKIESTQRKKVLKMMKALERELVHDLVDIDPTAPKKTALQQKRLKALLKQTRKTINTYIDGSSKALTKDLYDLVEMEAAFTEGMFNAALGARVATVSISTARLKAMAKNTLVEGEYPAQWWKKQARSLQDKFAREMRNGLGKGETIGELSRRVRNRVMPMGRRNADALVRTSTMAVIQEARRESYRQVADLIKGYKYVATLDTRTTPYCRAADGTVFNKSYKVVKGPSWVKVPPNHWGCRSTISPITKSWAELEKQYKGTKKMKELEKVPTKTRASMDGKVPRTLTYTEWLKRQSKERQIEILGPTRAKLFREGEIKSMTQLLDQSGEYLTIAELKKRIAEGALVDPITGNLMLNSLTDKGKEVAKTIKTQQALLADMNNPDKEVVFYKETPVPKSKFKSVEKPNLKQKPIWEPEDPDLNGKSYSAGVVMFDENSEKVWIFEPKDHFGGYKHSFPKGRVEKSLTAQETAIKEAWEETGLQAELLDHLGDYEKTTTMNRYYVARWKGGDPTKAGWEAQSVKLVPRSKLKAYLNRKVDRRIADDFEAAWSRAVHAEPGSPTNGFRALNLRKKEKAIEKAKMAAKKAEEKALKEEYRAALLNGKEPTPAAKSAWEKIATETDKKALRAELAVKRVEERAAASLEELKKKAATGKMTPEEKAAWAKLKELPADNPIRESPSASLLYFEDHKKLQKELFEKKKKELQAFKKEKGKDPYYQKAFRAVSENQDPEEYIKAVESHVKNTKKAYQLADKALEDQYPNTYPEVAKTFEYETGKSWSELSDIERVDYFSENKDRVEKALNAFNDSLTMDPDALKAHIQLGKETWYQELPIKEKAQALKNQINTNKKTYQEVLRSDTGKEALKEAKEEYGPDWETLSYPDKTEAVLNKIEEWDGYANKVDSFYKTPEGKEALLLASSEDPLTMSLGTPKEKYTLLKKYEKKAQNDIKAAKKFEEAHPDAYGEAHLSYGPDFDELPAGKKLELMKKAQRQLADKEEAAASAKIIEQEKEFQALSEKPDSKKAVEWMRKEHPDIYEEYVETLSTGSPLDKKGFLVDTIYEWEQAGKPIVKELKPGDVPVPKLKKSALNKKLLSYMNDEAVEEWLGKGTVKLGSKTFPMDGKGNTTKFLSKWKDHLNGYKKSILSGKKPTKMQKGAYDLLNADGKAIIDKEIESVFHQMGIEIPGAKPKTVPPLEKKVLDYNDFEKYESQKGSNQGGFFARKDNPGERWYFKFPESEDIARNELLAAKLYEKAGVEVPELAEVDWDGKKGVASRVIDGVKKDPDALKSGRYAKDIEENFIVDAWLGDWDVVGTGYDNLLIRGDRAIRIDVGGSLRYRAMGGKKTASQWNGVVSEIENMRDPRMNPYGAEVFKNVTKEQMEIGARKVLSISDKDIRDLVRAYGPVDKKEAEELIETLIERKKYLAEKFPNAVPDKSRPVPLDLKAGEYVAPSEIQDIVDSRINGTVLRTDKDQIEDVEVLFWTEKDVDGSDLTLASFKVRDKGVRILEEQVKGAEVFDSLKNRVTFEDVTDSLHTAMKGISMQARNGQGLRLKDIERAKKAVQTYHTRLDDLVEKKKRGLISQKEIAEYQKTFHHWYEHVNRVSELEAGDLYDFPDKIYGGAELAARRPDNFSIQLKIEKYKKKKEEFNWVRKYGTAPEKKIKNGYAQRTGKEISWSVKEEYFEAVDGDVVIKYWPSSTDMAIRNRVEIMVKGEPVTGVDDIASVMKRLGLNVERATPEYQEELYLIQHMNVLNRPKEFSKVLEGLKDVKDSKKRVEYLKTRLNGWIGYDITESPDYNPFGSKQAWGHGRQFNERADLVMDPQWASFEQNYRLVHRITNGHISDVLDRILEGGGQMAPTTDKLRRGFRPGGMSPERDMETGGASYFFTRIRPKHRTYEKGTFVWKSRTLKRLDAISYDDDYYGNVGPNFLERRASTINQFKQYSNRDGNETLFKNSLSIFDDIQYINVDSFEYEAVVSTLKKHLKSDFFPDGRPITDVVRIP